MIPSILDSTKKVLGLNQDYDAFDDDVLTHINAAFSILTQLGVGPVDGFRVENEGLEWQEYDVPQTQRELVKTYVFLKVKVLFDPPATSFHLTAAENQIKEYEWRLNDMREVVSAVNLPPPIVPEFDGQAIIVPEVPDPQLDAPDITVNALENEVRVTWTAVDNAELYQVWFNNYQNLGPTVWVVVDWTDSELSLSFDSVVGLQYEVYVVAKAAGYSDGESEHQTVTGTDTAPMLEAPLNPNVAPFHDVNDDTSKINVSWSDTPNVEIVLVWYKEVGDLDFDVVGCPIDQFAVNIASEVGIDYEYYLQSTADGWASAETSHFFVTGV